MFGFEQLNYIMDDLHELKDNLHHLKIRIEELEHDMVRMQDYVTARDIPHIQQHVKVEELIPVVKTYGKALNKSIVLDSNGLVKEVDNTIDPLKNYLKL